MAGEHVSSLRGGTESVRRITGTKNISRAFSSAVGASEKDKWPLDGDRLRCSFDGAPTPAGKQTNGDPAAT
ncbi:hypothetical protein EVJ25_00275 [Exiguobacterium sp. SH1S4]|nr:hypothetical protein EVJ29_03930 [Exiguobacterium sp. SH4S7]TCI47512.1 hypothetical protein EVJ31_00275 [Exiguobacterium sp. SH5S32]TCI54395.1 hypothetical protein EVJ25_00275 [Exiguobacterium sp. SH1S4]TCI65099.1 hypothetical protein EVJ21_00435 [Exiguobacterium sp. SH0S2]TCI74189.1 hypothetical protein EVJ23_00275 [Exiguobacterium sp. SH1S1]